MGFKEEHIHRGTSCVGFDLNALLSWLFEHPDGGSTPAEQASAAARCAFLARSARSVGDRTSVFWCWNAWDERNGV